MTEERNILEVEFLQQEFRLLNENMSAFIGCRREDPSQIRRMEANWGGDKLSIRVDEALILYLWGFHSRTPEFPPIFDADTLKKWKAVTIFACGKYVSIKDPEGVSMDLVSPILIEKELYSSLSALAGFPLLENIARKISKKWDDHGKIIESFCILGKDYKVNQTISSFKDKMHVMMLSMPSQTQEHWSNIDKLTRRPDIEGCPYDDIPSLFERLHKRRNSWAHGHEFEGEEGILISLILRFLYLNCALFQVK
jgi:hypothetical protein